VVVEEIGVGNLEDEQPYEKDDGECDEEDAVGRGEGGGFGGVVVHFADKWSAEGKGDRK
jgi:hypothetical protein